MKKTKRVLAGIEEGDIETAKKRLADGEIFYFFSGKLHYCSSFIAKGESPYRYETVSIISCWWYVHKWRIELVEVS